MKASLKVKELKEKLKKSEADKRLVEEQLGEEIRKLNSIHDQFEQSLGARSSYATKASQSVRALVELIEGQKLELESQVQTLKAEVESLQKKTDSLAETNAQLEDEVERLQTGVKEEVTVAVGAELEALRFQCNALQNESRAAKEQRQLLEERYKREQESRRSFEEQLHKQKSQVQTRDSCNPGMQVYVAVSYTTIYCC